MKYKKCIVSVLYFVVYFAKTFYPRNVKYNKCITGLKILALMKTVYRNDVLSCAPLFHQYTFFTVVRLAAALLRSGQPKTSSTEITTNTIEAIIMEDQSLTVRELGAMLDNFCTSFFSCVRFGIVNSNRFYKICYNAASMLPFRVKLGLPM